MKRIVITGGSLNGNSGAEAMLNTVIRRIQEVLPNAEFGIFTPYYKDDNLLWRHNVPEKIKLIDASPLILLIKIFPLSIIAGFFKIIRFKNAIKIFPKSIRFIWQADACIDIAGVSFIDNRLKFLPFNILSIYPAFLMRVPVIKYAQATGPYNNIINRIFARHCFKKCEHVFARGDKTFQYLQSLKIPKQKYSLSTDIAFCGKPGDSFISKMPHFDVFISEITSNKKNNKKIIGVCPSSVIYSQSLKQGFQYVDFMTDLCIKLIEKDYHVVLFANATKAHKPNTYRNNDIPLIIQISDRIKSPNISSYKGNLNADEVKTIIESVDFCLVSRFHAMIFALTLKKPLFVIGWSHKYKEVMNQFGLSKYIVDYKSSNMDEILSVVDYICLNMHYIETVIEKHLETVKTISYQQVKYTLNLLMNSRSDVY